MSPRPREFDVTSPWARQPCDGERDWPIFQAYLTTPAPRPRSMRGLASAWGVNWSDLEALSRTNGWADRAAAWDRHLDQVRIDAAERYAEDTGRDVARRHLDHARKVVALAGRELSKYLEASEASDMPGLLTPQAALRFLEVGAKLERLVMGDVTDRTQVDARAPDMSALSVDELRNLAAIQAKAGAR